MSPHIESYIESGVLELYVMGAISGPEAHAVEQMAAAHPEVREKLNDISEALERYARAHAVKPRNVVKPLLLATIDYMERMKKGELPSSPPVLTARSRPEDFARWLNRPDMALPDGMGEIYARIIGYTPAATTAIVWLSGEIDAEVHDDEHERFLIVEGTCRIMVGDITHSLKPGSFFAVPLHERHQVVVTSAVPCKAILQRLSAA